MMKNILTYFYIALITAMLPLSLLAMTPGTLDPSFGGGTLGPKPGTVVTDFPAPASIEQAYALIRQPDHKLVAAGFTETGGSNFDFALARYLPDGKLDTTFGPDGRVTTNFGAGIDTAFALIIQLDGKLVAAGRTDVNGTNDFALARYLPDGSLDTSFGTGGKTTTSFGASSDDIANALIIQSDGKLVAAGRTNVNGTADFALVRYNADGTLDTSFGTGGKTTTSFGASSNDIAFALTIQSDGKLVAAGTTNVNGTADFALVRYNADGTLDTSFGSGGKVITGFGVGSDDIARALILQPDGKLVAAGRTNVNGTADFALVRYNADGTLDTSFGTGGKVITNLGGADEAEALVLQPDGKLVAAGITDVNSTNDFALVRYNTDGTLDTTFNPNGLMPGVVITAFANGVDQANALAIQTEGTQLKLVAAGEASLNFGLAQYFAVNDISPLASNVIAKYCVN